MIPYLDTWVVSDVGSRLQLVGKLWPRSELKKKGHFFVKNYTKAKSMTIEDCQTNFILTAISMRKKIQFLNL